MMLNGIRTPLAVTGGRHVGALGTGATTRFWNSSTVANKTYEYQVRVVHASKQGKGSWLAQIRTARFLYPGRCPDPWLSERVSQAAETTVFVLRTEHDIVAVGGNKAFLFQSSTERVSGIRHLSKPQQDEFPDDTIRKAPRAARTA